MQLAREPLSFCRLAVVFSLLAGAFSVAGCTTIGTKNASESSGGTVNAAWTLGGKCDAVLAWLTFFDREYTGLDSAYGYFQQLSNLFRDRFFVPVYGKPFDKMTAQERSSLYTLSNECSGVGSNITKFQQSIGRHRELLNAAFNSLSGTIASTLGQMRPLETWMEESLKSLKDLPLDQKSFSLVQSRLDEGSTKLKVLFPSEYQNFVSVYTKSRDSMAKALIAKLAQEVEGMEPSLVNVRRVKNEILPNVKQYQDAAGSSAGPDLRPQFTQKLETMVNQLVPERVSALKAIPDTDAGLKPSEQWYRQFDEDFSPYKPLASVKDALSLLSKKRDDMYRSGQPAFFFSLNSVDARFENISRGESLLQQAFALPNDLTLPVYREYEKAVRAKKDQILGKLSEQKLAELRAMPITLDAAVAMLQWRKELEEQYAKFRGVSSIDSMFKEYETKRVQILKGASQEFALKQQALPPTRDGLRRSVDMLDSLFPNLTDESLTIYPEYKNMVLARVGSIRSTTRR